MTTDIEPHNTNNYVIQHAETDSWIGILAEVADLAAKISTTEFVPDSLRGKPAAIAAAILTGREMGVPPMTALANIHVIKGKPSQSALLMRALVLARGHDIRDIETTDTRCIVEGRRRGEEEWTRVTFTADQAKRAKIDLGGYPEDKLYARATSRLCRRKFADVLGGMPYSAEELRDGDIDLVEPGPTPSALEPPEEPKRRTAQRKTVTRPPPAAPHTAAEPQPEDTGPPLPGEDGYDDNEPPNPEEAPPTTGAITGPQRTKLHTIFGNIGINDRRERLRISSNIVNRKVTSSLDLTKHEATALIDSLEWATRQPNPINHLNQLAEATETVNPETGELFDLPPGEQHP